MPIIYLAGTRKSEKCILHTQLFGMLPEKPVLLHPECGGIWNRWNALEQLRTKRHRWVLVAGAAHRSQLSPQQMARNSVDSADLSNLCGSQQMTQFSAEGRNLRRLCSSQQLEYICKSEMRYLTKRLLQEGERESGLLPHVLAS